MNVRLALWTFGMALVGLFFTIEGGIPSHSTILLGSVAGAGVGLGGSSGGITFGVGAGVGAEVGRSIANC